MPFCLKKMTGGSRGLALGTLKCWARQGSGLWVMRLLVGSKPCLGVGLVELAKGIIGIVRHAYFTGADQVTICGLYWGFIARCWLALQHLK